MVKLYKYTAHCMVESLKELVKMIVDKLVYILAAAVLIGAQRVCQKVEKKQLCWWQAH